MLSIRIVLVQVLCVALATASVTFYVSPTGESMGTAIVPPAFEAAPRLLFEASPANRYAPTCEKPRQLFDLAHQFPHESPPKFRIQLQDRMPIPAPRHLRSRRLAEHAMLFALLAMLPQARSHPVALL